MSMIEILTALTSTFYAESQPLILIFVVKLKVSRTLAFQYVCYLSRRIQFKTHHESVHVITMKRGTRLLSDRKKEGCLTVPLSWCNALMLFQLGAFELGLHISTRKCEFWPCQDLWTLPYRIVLAFVSAINQAKFCIVLALLVKTVFILNWRLWEM